MAVLVRALTLGMGVVEILRMAFAVVDVALGKVVPLVERALVAQDRADDVVASLVQRVLAFEYLPTRGHDAFECNATAFIVQTPTSQISTFDTSTTPFVFNDVGAAIGSGTGPLGYNVRDGLLYGVRMGGAPTATRELFTFDSQGRINLPDHLREFAGLDKDATLIGAANHIAIFPAEVHSPEAALDALIDVSDLL